MSIQLAPLHIPAIRAGPGFETDTSAAVKRHTAHWAYNDEGFNQHYGSGYYDRKHMFAYPYPETQFPVGVSMATAPPTPPHQL